MNYNSDTEFLGIYTKNTLLDEIKKNLSKCKSFTFSVSFTKLSGLELIIEDVLSALKRGAKGLFLTSTYMSVTQSAALRELLSLMEEYPNFKAYLWREEDGGLASFHTKGYLFEHENSSTVIVGSSNLSETALYYHKGGEWSLSANTEASSKLYNDIIDEVQSHLLPASHVITEKIIKEYECSVGNVALDGIIPNKMQEEALRALKISRDKGKRKALIIAAMGSGKTFLSAFDAKNFEANRVLYICPSESVLIKTKTSYEQVFRDTKTYSLYTGNSKNINSDFVFATNIMMAKNLTKFDKRDFDYLIIDEAHHVPASTFEKIVKYFNPEFLLGMTGTEERMDLKNVRSYFDNEIPFQLSLRDAIESGLIMPFVYKSVYDDALNYSLKYDPSCLYDEMVANDHCVFIKNTIEANLDYISGKLKCLAFCVDTRHAKKLSETMTSLGIESTYITGDTPTFERSRIFDSLQDENHPLKIIFSINTMNEGVDLPKVNMSLLLRPTESITVFTQQLGRCLRIAEGKKKPIILDFIGQEYERSVFLASALGQLSKAPILTKPILKNILTGRQSDIADLGIEILIDPKSEKEIRKAVDACNFNQEKVLKRDYESFKACYSFSTQPQHTDFLGQTYFDLNRIVKKYKCFYNFLTKNDSINLPTFLKSETDFIVFLSAMLPLSRPYEYQIFKVLIEYGEQSYTDLKKRLVNSIEVFDEISFKHALDYLTGALESPEKANKSIKYIAYNENKYSFVSNVDDLEIKDNEEYIEIDFNNAEFREHVLNIIEYGLSRFKEEHIGFNNNLELYETYSRLEFTRIVNYSSVYTFQPGVMFFHDNKDVALFIDMIKDSNVEEHLNYGDKFIERNLLIWESQTETVIGNKRYNKLMSFDKVHIFVRKFKEEDGVLLPYVYLGTGKLTKPRKSTNVKDTVLFDCVLDNELPMHLFEQFNIED